MISLRASTMLVLLMLPAAAAAQTTTTPPDQTGTQPPAQPAVQTAPEHSDPDVRVDPLQPDFNLAALPTTLRLPAHKLSFRVTHRFTRSVGEGDFGDLLSNFFTFDSAAQIGLELRYGLMPGTQIGIHRTSDKSIELFGQHNFLKERDGRPIGLDAIVTFEGEDNLHRHHQGAFGLVASRFVGKRAALYVEPIFVANSNDTVSGADNSTAMIGLGARVRIRPATYLMAEFTPRVAGFDPGTDQVSFGLEERVGGHLFQINVSNGFGTTLGQLARGGVSRDSWYIGFNIARKFF